MNCQILVSEKISYYTSSANFIQRTLTVKSLLSSVKVKKHVILRKKVSTFCSICQRQGLTILRSNLLKITVLHLFQQHLTVTSLGKCSRRQIDDIFLIFPRKQVLTFHAKCLHYWRHFAGNVKSCFLGN